MKRRGTPLRLRRFPTATPGAFGPLQPPLPPLPPQSSLAISNALSQISKSVAASLVLAAEGMEGTHGTSFFAAALNRCPHFILTFAGKPGPEEEDSSWRISMAGAAAMAASAYRASSAEVLLQVGAHTPGAGLPPTFVLLADLSHGPKAPVEGCAADGTTLPPASATSAALAAEAVGSAHVRPCVWLGPHDLAARGSPSKSSVDGSSAYPGGDLWQAAAAVPLRFVVGSSRSGEVSRLTAPPTTVIFLFYWTEITSETVCGPTGTFYLADIAKTARMAAAATPAVGGAIISTTPTTAGAASTPILPFVMPLPAVFSGMTWPEGSGALSSRMGSLGGMLRPGSGLDLLAALGGEGPAGDEEEEEEEGGGIDAEEEEGQEGGQEEGEDEPYVQARAAGRGRVRGPRRGRGRSKRPSAPYSLHPSEHGIMTASGLPAVSANALSRVKGRSRAAAPKMDVALRRGKWPHEEEELTTAIVEGFKAGLLPLAPGATLRTYLSGQLHCGEYARPWLRSVRSHLSHPTLSQRPCASPRSLPRTRLSASRCTAAAWTATTSGGRRTATPCVLASARCAPASSRPCSAGTTSTSL